MQEGIPLATHGPYTVLPSSMRQMRVLSGGRGVEAEPEGPWV